MGRKVPNETQVTKKRCVLGSILESPENFIGRLHMSFDESWSLESECLVVGSDDPDDDAPDKAAAALGFDYVMGMDVVQSIVANAREQKPRATADELLAAFLHYYDRDAYVEF